MKRPIRFLSISFILIGILIIGNSLLSITGYTILDNINNSKGYYVGAWFIASGIILLTISLREAYNAELKSRQSLRMHNHEAHFYAEKHYKEIYGRKPTHEELREYIREIHESGDIHDIIEEEKRGKKQKVA